MTTLLATSFPVFKAQASTKRKINIKSQLIFEEECRALKQDLARASTGDQFVLCVNNPNPSAKGFIIPDDIYLLPALSLAVPKLTGKRVCQIFHIGFDPFPFEDTYNCIRICHEYNPFRWQVALNIEWKRYAECHEYTELSDQHIYDITRLYIGREYLHFPLRLPTESAGHNRFSHLLFVDGLEEHMLPYLRNVVNPKALTLNQETKIENLVDLCQKLNPGNEKGNVALILKMSPGLFEKLGGILRRLKYEGIPATWIVDPIVAVEEDSCYRTWDMKSSLELLKDIQGLFDKEGNNIGGLYLEATSLNVSSAFELLESFTS